MRVGLGDTCIVATDSEEVKSFLANGGEITPIVLVPDAE